MLPVYLERKTIKLNQRLIFICALRSQRIFLQCNIFDVASQHEKIDNHLNGVDLILPDATSKLIPPSARQAGVFSWSISAKRKCGQHPRQIKPRAKVFAPPIAEGNDGMRTPKSYPSM